MFIWIQFMSQFLISEFKRIKKRYQTSITPTNKKCLQNFLISKKYSNKRKQPIYLNHSLRIHLTHNIQNLMNFTFHLVRHAHSQHNLQKQNWKQTHKDPNFKQTIQYNALKFKRELIDPSIISATQIKIVKQAIDFNKVELILCSPLKRCLQTCAQLVKEHKGKVKVIVEPYLNSRLSSAWSIGSNANELRNQYPQFDFSAFDGIEDIWMMKFLQKIRKLQQECLQKNQSKSQSLLLQMLINNKGQNYYEFFERVKELKKRIKSRVQGYQLEDKAKNQVVIISHSCVLNFLLGKELNEKGKVKNKIVFQHCNPKTFTALQFFHTLPGEICKDSHTAKL